MGGMLFFVLADQISVGNFAAWIPMIPCQRQDSLPKGLCKLTCPPGTLSERSESKGQP